MRSILIFIFCFSIQALSAMSFVFSNIDGGTLDTKDWLGKPVLVTNTASHCFFTKQYEGLQSLYEKYKERGLIVLAVPSDDFNQELESNAAVKEFCDVNFNTDLPMTEITKVIGEDAHPFYKWVKENTDFSPKWNFSKVLISPAGEIVDTFGPLTGPNSRKITNHIENLLAKGN